MTAEGEISRDSEEVEVEIRKCAIVGAVFLLLALACLALGIVSDALDTTLGLESMSWFLLAIFCGLLIIVIPLANVFEIRLKDLRRKQ